MFTMVTAPVLSQIHSFYDFKLYYVGIIFSSKQQLTKPFATRLPNINKD